MTEPTATILTPARRRSRPHTGLLLTAFLLLFAQIAHAAPRFMTVRVTFYSPSSRSKTATGRSARLPGVAVDPAVIPLGSRVAVPGFGVRVADDTGGAVKGNHIDIRLPTGNRAMARKHGVKHLRVRIVHPKKSPKRHNAEETTRTRKARLARAHRAKTARHTRELKAKQAKALKRRAQIAQKEKRAHHKKARTKRHAN